MSTLLQHRSSMPNMNKSISTMLCSTNTIACWINGKIYSMYYPNTNNYLMAPLDSIHTKSFTLTSNLEPSKCITMLILFLNYTDKLPKKNLITWLNLVSLNHAGLLNGRPQPSLFQKRMGRFDKSLTYAPLTKQSYVNNTPYQSYQIY